MNNYQANLNTNPLKNCSFITIRQYLYWLFWLSSINQIFQSLLIIALIMINTIACAMKREAWTRYLPSHLVPVKILCSRCEPCTKVLFKLFDNPPASTFSYKLTDRLSCLSWSRKYRIHDLRICDYSDHICVDSSEWQSQVLHKRIRVDNHNVPALNLKWKQENYWNIFNRKVGL